MAALPPQRPWLALALAAIALTGCGRDAGLTPARPARLVTSVRPAGPVPPAAPGLPPGAVPAGGGQAGGLWPGAAPAAGQATGIGAGTRTAIEGITEGERLLTAVRAQAARLTSFEATIRSFSQGFYSGGQRTGELKRATTESKLTWAQPNRLRVEVLKTSNPIAEGAVLTTHDLVTCRVRAKGLLSWLPISMPATDAKLANNRNHTLPEMNPKATLDRLTAPGAAWTLMGDAVVEGIPLKVVRVSGVKALDAEIDREVIGVDPVQLAIVKVTMYAGQTKVGDHTMMSVRVNPTLGPETFRL
ncbi:MAG: hypothetical protein VKQ33_00230 [Candidatus Sericytochromatia bacterium]|nr:hypothetical protein [Candidatus Sericytochromatia bacterium]